MENKPTQENQEQTELLKKFDASFRNFKRSFTIFELDRKPEVERLFHEVKESNSTILNHSGTELSLEITPVRAPLKEFLEKSEPWCAELVISINDIGKLTRFIQAIDPKGDSRVKEIALRFFKALDVFSQRESAENPGESVFEFLAFYEDLAKAFEYLGFVRAGQWIGFCGESIKYGYYKEFLDLYNSNLKDIFTYEPSDHQEDDTFETNMKDVGLYGAWKTEKLYYLDNSIDEFESFSNNENAVKGIMFPRMVVQYIILIKQWTKTISKFKENPEAENVFADIKSFIDRYSGILEKLLENEVMEKDLHQLIKQSLLKLEVIKKSI